jgi:tetratricopeptide (TPR) repeat protein
VPAAVDDVLLRGLARDPGERWGTATAFVDGLERADAERAPVQPTPVQPTPVQPTPVQPPPPPPAPVTWSHPRRRMGAAPVLLGLAAIAVGLIVGLTVLNGNDGSGGGTDRSPERARTAQRDERRQSERAQQPAPAPAPAETQRSDASPAQLNDQGFGLMNAGDYDRAIPVLERAVAAFPEGNTDLTLAYALYNLGRSLRLAGRPDEAIPILERRLEFSNQRGVVKRELKAARKAAG